jgi:hypothetical protein
MGLIHTRASKKRDKAEAKLATTETKALKRQTAAAEAEQKSEQRAAHVAAYLAGDYPKWRLTPMENVMLREAQKES